VAEAMSDGGGRAAGAVERVRGAIIRGAPERRALALCFTGHEFGESLPVILEALRRRAAQASFFFTGDFLRNAAFAPAVQQLVQDGHYLGPHSGHHLHYSSGSPDRRTLVRHDEFVADVRANLAEVTRYGVPGAQQRD